MKKQLTKSVIRFGLFCLVLGGTVILLSACGKQAEAAAPTLPTAEAPSFSEELHEKIKANWERWDALSWQQQGLSSTMPGLEYRKFYTWEEATDYIGFVPWNPLEEANWLQKKNTSGTDVLPEGETKLKHAEVRFQGNRDGSLTNVVLQAGYADGQVRVILTADMITRTTYSEEAGKTVSLSERLSAKETRDQGELYQAVNLYFDRENVFYSIRLIVGKSSAANAALEEIYENLLTLLRETLGHGS